MIFKRELFKSQKSLWIWVAALGGLVFLMLSIYPEFAKQQEDLEKLLEIYPESIMKAFNIDQLGLSTVLGFYAIEGYLFVTLFGSIFVAIMASNMLVKEENDKTIEFLLAKPVTRTRVVTEKLLALIANIFLFNFAVAIITFLGFQLTDDQSYDLKTFFILTSAPLLLHLTFAAVAYMVSSMIRKSRIVLSFSLGLVLFSYVLYMIQGISDKLESLKYITPFEYVDAAYIIENESIRPLYFVIMICTIAVSILITYFVYRKKDFAV